MNGYNRSEAYDINYAAPALEFPYEEPQIRKAKSANKTKSLITVNKATYAGIILAAKTVALAVVLLALFLGILRTRIDFEKLNRETTKIQSMISDAESENTRLKVQLSSTVSREKVEAYATTVLGMHKLERNQIHYFEDKTGDEVVLANGKVPEAKAEKQ